MSLYVAEIYKKPTKKEIYIFSDPFCCIFGNIKTVFGWLCDRRTIERECYIIAGNPRGTMADFEGRHVMIGTNFVALCVL